MRFEDAVTGTLCGGALLLLMFDVYPPESPVTHAEPPAVVLTRDAAIGGHPECIER